MKTGETKGSLPCPASALALATFALGTILVLSACSGAKTRTVQGEGDPEAVQAAEAGAQAAEARAKAADEALNDLRDSLAAARAALASADDAGQRTAVAQVREDLEGVRQVLEGLPESPARTVVDAALTAVDTALMRTVEALADTNAALVPGAGSLVFASMHTALARTVLARTALDDAQTALKAAQAANPSPELSTLLSQARGVITTAQVSLLPLPRQELDDARSEASAAAARARTAETRRDEWTVRAEAVEAERDVERARADTYGPRVSLATALVPGAERFVPLDEAASITRTPRTGPEGHRKLDIRTGAVAWGTGKRVASEGGALGTTDELPLRSVTLRAGGRHPIEVQGDDGTPTSYSNTDGVLNSSLRIRADGVTLKFGGEGVVYSDMQRTFDYFSDAFGTPDHDSWWRYGPDGKLGDASAAAGQTITDSHARDLGVAAGGTLTGDQATALVGYATDNNPTGGDCWTPPLSDCGDWAHDDITITFGAPSQPPQGEASWYWKEQIPFTDEQREQGSTGLPRNFGSGWNGKQGDADAEAGQTITDSHARDLGVAAGGTLTPPQAALLKAYAAYHGDGRDAGELGSYELWLSNYAGLDQGADADDASDDAHRYLRYSVYGLFMFFDNVVNTPAYVRPQAFATGYDTFRDADGMRPGDITTSIGATFTGHTTARLLISDGNPTHVVIQRGTTPLRGDVTLSACIGGAGCTGDGIPSGANRISGQISDIERLRPDGAWVDFTHARSIRMMEGDIAADGSFGGDLAHPMNAEERVNSWNFNAGSGTSSGYSGNFYGPRNALEAAGWWWMEPDSREWDKPAPPADSAHPGYLGIIGSFGAECTEGCS